MSPPLLTVPNLQPKQAADLVSLRAELRRARELGGSGAGGLRGQAREQAVAALGRIEKPMNPALVRDRLAALASEPDLGWDPRLLLELHFLDRHPAPEAGKLMEGGPGGLERLGAAMAPLWDRSADPLAAAAIAHLNLAALKPFRRANLSSRIHLHDLAVARATETDPDLSSVAPVIAKNRHTYEVTLRAALTGSEVAIGAWLGFWSAMPRERAREVASQLESRNGSRELLLGLCERRGWPDRLAEAMELALQGPADSAGYRGLTGVSPPTAAADFRRLTDAGLLVRKGRGPATRYEAESRLARMLA